MLSGTQRQLPPSATKKRDTIHLFLFPRPKIGFSGVSRMVVSGNPGTHLDLSTLLSKRIITGLQSRVTDDALSAPLGSGSGSEWCA
jgi:hypothetical protein